MKKFDIIIIGAGISGITLAQKYASIGKSVLILEKRDHIGGNCYDYINSMGILISKYGAHLFHTNIEFVWKYVNQFADWYHYEHHVLAKVDNKLVPIPVNIQTVNSIFNLNIKTENEMKDWLKKNQVISSNPNNSKEAALAKVGEILYEKMFKNYTKKQWDKYPEELNPEVLNRIPVRSNFDNRYFSDKYQALPRGGYTKLFSNMLNHKNITVMLNTDYFNIKNKINLYNKLFYTGPIDKFFDFKYSIGVPLEYRSIKFVWENHPQEYYQENSVINYPNDEEFTRIIEYKYFTNIKVLSTTICKEYSVNYIPGKNEPFYPVPSPINQEIYKRYQVAAQKLKNIYFVGRLANYKYFNMDQAFENALNLFSNLELNKN